MKYPVNIQVFDWLPLIHVTADSICWYWTNPFLKFALACEFFQLERVTLFMQLRNWCGHLFKTERHSNWLFDSLQSVLIVKCCLVSVPLSPLWSSWSNTALPLEVPLQRVQGFELQRTAAYSPQNFVRKHEFRWGVLLNLLPKVCRLKVLIWSTKIVRWLQILPETNNT